MPDPKFIDAPAPQFVDAEGPKFIDAAAPRIPMAASHTSYQSPQMAASHVVGAIPKTNPAMDSDIEIMSKIIGPDRAMRAIRSGDYEPGMITRLTQPDNSFMGRLNVYTGGALSGIRDITLGQARTVQHLLGKIGIVGEDQLALTDALVKAREQGLAVNGIGSGFGAPSRLTANALTSFSPFSLVGKIPGASAPTFASRVGLSGLMGMGGAAVQPDASPESVMGGGALGASIPVVAEKVVAPVLGKAINAGRNLLAGRLATASPEVQAVEDLATQHGVRTTAGDLTGAPGFKKTEVLLENVPGAGMANFRKLQGTEAEAAVRKYVADLGESLDGQDWNQAVQKGAANKLGERVAKASDLYDEVGRLAGTRQAQRNNVIQAMQNALSENARASSPDEALAADLTNRIRRLTQNSVEAERLGEAPMDKSWQGMRDLRTEFGKAAQKYRLSDPAKASMYDDLRQATNQDLVDFAESSGNPELIAANRKADQYYAKEVMPFKQHSKEYGDWAKALKGKDAEPEQIYKYFVQANRDGKAQYFYRALDDKGRDAVRFGMAQNALDAALVPIRGSEGATFSPAKFAKSLEDQSSAAGVFFKGEQKFELDGLTKLMRHVERAGQFAENPPTGNRVAQLAVGGGLAEIASKVSPTAAATTWLSAAGLKQLLTTKAGKAILLASSNLKAGSPEMARVLARAETFTAKTNAAVSAPNVTPFRPMPQQVPQVAQSEE